MPCYDLWICLGFMWLLTHDVISRRSPLVAGFPSIVLQCFHTRMSHRGHVTWHLTPSHVLYTAPICRCRLLSVYAERRTGPQIYLFLSLRCDLRIPTQGADVLATVLLQWFINVMNNSTLQFHTTTNLYIQLLLFSVNVRKWLWTFCRELTRKFFKME